MHSRYAYIAFLSAKRKETVTNNTKHHIELPYVDSNSTADELDKTLKRFLISVVGRCFVLERLADLTRQGIYHFLSDSSYYCGYCGFAA